MHSFIYNYFSNFSENAMLVFAGTTALMFFAVSLFTFQRKFGVRAVVCVCYIVLVDILIWGIPILCLPIEMFPTIDLAIFGCIHIAILPLSVVLNLRRISGGKVDFSKSVLLYSMGIKQDNRG